MAGAIAVHPHLPARVATHFDMEGRPNGWSSAGSLWVPGGVMFGFAILIGIGVPALARRLPPSMVNVPHRDYWLAPERREASLDRLDVFMGVFGCGLAVFFLGVLALVAHANIAGQGRMEAWGMWGLLGGVFVFTGGWLWKLYSSFPKPHA